MPQFEPPQGLCHRADRWWTVCVLQYEIVTRNVPMPQAVPRRKSSRSGTQTVERAARLLRELALNGAFGWRASDLAEHCGLDRATTQRLLACLTRERLAQQRPSDRRYLPGPLLFELGLSVPGLHAVQTLAGPAVNRTATKLDAVAALYLRSGEDIVCALRAGSTTIKALSSEVGTRRPAVMSAGGVAILMALPVSERSELIAGGLARVPRQGQARLRAIEAMLSDSERSGYAVNAGQVVPGVHAFGVAIHAPHGEVFASLSIAGPSATLPVAKAGQILKVLRAEAAAIEAELAQKAHSLYAHNVT
jgi:DNA-binding IclR family transcriptional regulator